MYVLRRFIVSTLLEILALPVFGCKCGCAGRKFQPFLRFWIKNIDEPVELRLIVSTLLEILVGHIL